jgi:uncharacterized membrane protein YfcA
LALGTNKLQGTCGSGSAAWHYARARTVPLEDCSLGFALALLGGAVGTLSVLHLDPSFLRRVIPILLFVVALYMLFRPQLGDADRHPRMGRRAFDVLFGLLLGFYDGFFGPGVGTFWTMAYVLGLGFNLVKATGYCKVMNLASNLGSLMLFFAWGKVSLVAGLTMGAGQLLGARLGSKMVIRRGAKLVRPIFILVVLALTTKLLADAMFR